MISKSTIDKVYETARLEEVIGDFVQLKKSGSNFKGLSPFTEERTPSFMVSPVKQIWKDFSSGKGGNVVAFLMEHEHFSYPEAIKYLAKKYGIEVEETQQTDEQKQLASERESLYLVSEFAKDYFHKTLLHSEEGKAIGLTYFKERGFTDQTIKDFALGYNPNSWDAFTSEALGKGYKLDYLDKTGLTIVREDKQFDRFKGRVMFPIHSMSGRVLGFGGRILTNDKKAAKYVNSPESEIYQKSKILYGLYQAKQTIAKEDRCYLVEGYTDVIQMHQTGVTNVVASSGTALTPDQIRLIRRLTPNITVLFDGDAAGLRASLRGIDLILEQGMNVRVCTFPEGEDPDSFAKAHTQEQVIKFLEVESQDFINFKASLLAQESANDPVKKAATIREMVQSIAKIPDVIQREVYLQECSRIMEMSEEVLFNALAQLLSKEQKEHKKATRKPEQPPFEVIANQQLPTQKVDPLYEYERKILEILLLYGNLEAEFEDLVIEMDDQGEMQHKPEFHTAKVFEKVYLDLQDDEVELANPDFRALYYALIEHLNQGGEKIDSLIHTLEPGPASMATSILMDDERYQLGNWERKEIYVKDKAYSIGQYVSQTILNLRRLLISQKIEELANIVKDADDAARKEPLETIIDYQGLKKVLSNKLGRVL
ncbi:DNA primase [Gilvibacter sediminis]|uniref:DNA primase n=1 Tax=Gilvibacter sediminis TaxID=379071 RepID=UPI0023502740|nr:DNA primase [Gilvibacter sediminis]MDC7998661.1 DNA primase [Gilvibacter sediminis]